MLRYSLFIIFIVFCSASSAGTRSLLILGDSLSAAYGIAPDQGWVAQLRQRLSRQGYKYRVINASISGETTGGVKSRLPALLRKRRVDIAIIALGGNDGLRGTPIAEIENNLKYIVRQLRAQQAEILLVRIPLPPNYGKAYIDRFTAIYARLSRDATIALTDFGLREFGHRPDMMQEDGIHPTVAAQPLMLDNLWDDLLPLLEREE